MPVCQHLRRPGSSGGSCHRRADVKKLEPSSWEWKRPGGCPKPPSPQLRLKYLQHRSLRERNSSVLSTCQDLLPPFPPAERLTCPSKPGSTATLPASLTHSLRRESRGVCPGSMRHRVWKDRMLSTAAFLSPLCWCPREGHWTPCVYQAF